MGIIRRGRPSRQDPPALPGLYRFVRKDDGTVTYEGETNNLQRRKAEHTRNEFFEPDIEYFEWQVADGRSTSDTRREIERDRIDQHDPEKNRDGGGSGRRAHDWRSGTDEDDWDEDDDDDWDDD